MEGDQQHQREKGIPTRDRHPTTDHRIDEPASGAGGRISTGGVYSYQRAGTKVVVIGGTGHVGSYLVPRLVEAGYAVTVVSRGDREPYFSHGAWQQVKRLSLDRTILEQNGEFGENIASLEPDVVIDMICFQRRSCEQIVEALKGRIQHFLHCGTIWTHGPSTSVPTTEEEARDEPFGDYGIKKAEVQDYLLKQARLHGFPVTVLQPGHIVGKGWLPLNPQGNFSTEVYRKLSNGEELLLPNFGMETVHHVHADDVAQAFMLAIANRSVTIGESFHVTSSAAITLRGFANGIARFYGHKKANLKFVSWEEFKQKVSSIEAEATYDHIMHCPNCSIAKAQRLLGYQPRYSSLDAVTESIDYYFSVVHKDGAGGGGATACINNEAYNYLDNKQEIIN